jgi:integrase
MSERGGVHTFRPSFTRGDKTTGGGRRLFRTKTWAWRFSYRGRSYSGGKGYRTRAVARAAGEARKAEVVAGMILDPRKTTYETLEQIIVREYSLKSAGAVKRLKCHMKWLKTFFGGRLASEITRSDLIAYVQSRRNAKGAESTIRLELAYLRRAMRLAQDEGKMTAVPRFPSIQVYPRKGYFTREQWEAVHQELPPWWRGAFRVAYLTGWRFRSEILTRQWCHVDREAAVLRLDPGEGKKRRARVFPLTPELLEILDLQAVTVDRLERMHGRVIQWIFPGPTGQQMKNPYEAWHRACTKAGVPGKLPHDLRRTFIRDMNLARVPTPAGMAASGHHDERTYRGYVGEDEELVRWAVDQLQEQRAKPSNVVAIRRRNQTA